ncbi:MAG: phospholipase D family protein [Desulfobulbaceae bacterium]|nr:phospholipase D family protein [Desulfobulbaceae bacterium]
MRPTKRLISIFFLGCFLTQYSLASQGAETMTLGGRLDTLLADRGAEVSGALVLEKGEEALLARSWLTDQAEKSIDVQYFIWSTDNIGILAAEALLRGAERGVKVRVIVDDLLIDAPAESMLALAAHPNIQIKIYNPQHKVGVTTPERVFHMLTDFRSFNQRMHDKTFMVDGRVAVTGGRNMADEYFDFDHEYNFRDRDILLLGPVVTDMEESFEQFWQSPLAVPLEERLSWGAAKMTPAQVAVIYADLHRYAADPVNFTPEIRQIQAELPERFPALNAALTWGRVEFIHDRPGKNDRRISLGGGGEITRRLTAALAGAKKSVTIQSPYLIMPPGALDFFGELVKKGVRIRINTNSLASTDNLQAFSGYVDQRNKILKAGIEVYEFKPQPTIQKELIDRYQALKQYVPTFALHAKTMVIDGEFLFVGTFNLDPRSANLNTEVGVLVDNSQLAGQVEESMLRDMEPGNSWNAATDDPDSRAGLGKRFKTTFWRLLPLTPIL